MTSTRRTYIPAPGPVREVLHGIEVEDPFRWLEEQESPETRFFIQMEQQSYRKYLDHRKELRSRLERRVAELLTVASVDLPVPDQRGGLLYLKREAKEEQKAIYYRDKKNMEKLLISVAMLGRDSYTSLALLQVSPTAAILYSAFEQVAKIYRKSASTIWRRGYCSKMASPADSTGVWFSIREQAVSTMFTKNRQAGISIVERSGAMNSVAINRKISRSFTLAMAPLCASSYKAQKMARR